VAAAVAAAVAVLAVTATVGAMKGRPQALPTDRLPPVPAPTVAPPLGDCVMTKDTSPWASRYPWVRLDSTWRVAVHLDAPNAGTAPVEAVRYIGRGVERIKGLPAGFEVTTLNRAGVFAGVSTGQRGWVYLDGEFVPLTLPEGGTGVMLTGMTDGGDLVGIVNVAGDRESAAVVWRAGQPDRPRVLDTPGGRPARAYGIAWDGTVVGEVVAADGALTPYLWRPAGGGAALPGGTGLVGLVGDWAYGPGMRWNIRTGKGDVIDGVHGQVRIDDSGRVFGAGKDNRPAVWINGAVRKLPATWNGAQVQIEHVRADGRLISGRSAAGVWVRWDCS
jgi:hypothetical protein